MSDNSVSVLHHKIDKVIDELLNSVISLVGQRDFEGKIDTFPFFSLVINLKKSLYENILNHFAEDGSLEEFLSSNAENEDAFNTFCTKWAINKATPLTFPTLKSFRKSSEVRKGEDPRHNYLLIDTERLFSYISDLESIFHNTATLRFLYKLYEYTNLEKYERYHLSFHPDLISDNENYKIGMTPIHDVLISENWSEEDIDTFLTDIFFDNRLLAASSSTGYKVLWALFSDEGDDIYNLGHNPIYSNGWLENLFVYGIKDHRIATPSHDERMDRDNEKEHHNKNEEKSVFIEAVQRELKEGTIKSFLQLIIDICQYPAFAIPEQVLTSTLQQTYDNMFQVVLFQRVNIKCKEVGINRGDIKNKLDGKGVASKVTNAFGTYIADKRPDTDFINAVAKLLQVPSSYLTDI